MSDIRIYTGRGCGWAVRNYAALREKRVDFTAIPAVDASGNKLPEFLATTPYGKTPVLVDETTTVFESNIINEYIDERFPHPPLLPDDPQDRAAARKWIHYCDNSLLPQLTVIARSETAERESAVARLEKQLDWFESTVLATRNPEPYFFGDRFSLLEIAFHTFYTSLDAVRAHAGNDTAALPPRMHAWAEAIRQRESVRYAETFREELGF
jgi:glutathione S-transferase